MFAVGNKYIKKLKNKLFSTLSFKTLETLRGKLPYFISQKYLFLKSNLNSDHHIVV